MWTKRQSQKVLSAALLKKCTAEGRLCNFHKFLVFFVFFSIFRGYLARDSEGEPRNYTKGGERSRKLGRGAVGSRGKAKKGRDGRQEKRTMGTTKGTKTAKGHEI